VATLLLVVVQVGLVVRDQILLTHAAREGARAAAVDAAPGAALTAARAAGGLDPARLAVEVTGRGGPGTRVQVVATYDEPDDLPLVGRFLGDLRLRAEATMRVE
jgi:Flp pilus assembly protein TadG